MSRDKQISEMARVIEKMPWRIEQDGLGCRITNNTELAEYFYNAGYRKAADVADEIFADVHRKLLKMLMVADDGLIEAIIDADERTKNVCVTAKETIRTVLLCFAELKKKYESEKDNG